MSTTVRSAASRPRPPLPALAWSLMALAVAASATAVVLAMMLRPHPDSDLTFAVGQALLGIGYAGTGAVVASKAQRNVCGWILIAIGVFQAISNGGFMVDLAAGQTPQST